MWRPGPVAAIRALHPTAESCGLSEKDWYGFRPRGRRCIFGTCSHESISHACAVVPPLAGDGKVGRRDARSWFRGPGVARFSKVLHSSIVTNPASERSTTSRGRSSRTVTASRPHTGCAGHGASRAAPHVGKRGTRGPSGAGSKGSWPPGSARPSISPPNASRPASRSGGSLTDCTTGKRESRRVSAGTGSGAACVNAG